MQQWTYNVPAYVTTACVIKQIPETPLLDEQKRTLKQDNCEHQS